MKKSSLSFACAIALSSAAFVATVSYAAPARAQVSDADRKAARDLFFSGVELQNLGKFAEALERFQRAQQVVNAPTNLLHIAECQAALGKLVEAAESYRAVARFPMPANPPQAFVAAQSQAAGELAQLEPRIPEVTVEVTPPNVPTLQLTIDDQPVNAALVGVSRPVNPGAHKVVAQAAGYAREEKTIDVKERSKQKVQIELKSNGAVTYAPAGGAAPLVQTQPADPNPPKADKPAPYDASKSPAPEPRSRMSLFLGPRLGVAVPTGDAPLSDGNTVKMSEVSTAGAAIGAEAGFRFVRVLYVGLLAQYEGYGDKNASNTSVLSPSTSTITADAKSSGGLAGVTFGWISNPHGFGAILNAGVGYRWYTLERIIASSSGRASLTSTNKSNTTAVQLGVGLHIKMGKVFRLIPKIEVDFGSLKAANPNTGLDPAQGGAAIVYFGLSGYFDINLDKSAANPAAPASPAPASAGLLGPLAF